MTIPAIVFFTALMGVGGLAIDMQRVYGVHGQMQAYVDNVALAAAAELDGQTGALVRAFRAAHGDVNHGPLVTGTQNFATDTSLSVLRVTFLSALGTDPGAIGATPAPGDVVLCTWENNAWTPANCSTDITIIRTSNFVEVRAVPRTVSYLVLPVADVIGQMMGAAPLTNSATVQLRATAGYRQQICNNIPLMVCNPTEATGGSGAAFVPVPGQMMRATIQTSNLAPGDFAVINALSGNGANDVRDAYARVNPNTFCVSSVTVKGGANQGPVQQGLNVRMDWYLGTLGGGGGGFTTNAEYAPAPDVTKGLKPGNGQNGACNPTQSAQTMPFPRDNCFMLAPTPGAGTGCVNVGGTPKMGDTNWARNEYWNLNHKNPTTLVVDPQPLNYATMSRYQVYRYEVEHPQPIINHDEQSAPACYSNVASPPTTDIDHDRRVLIAAVLNCVADGNKLNGNTPVPAKIYAKLFMTEPAGNTAWDNFAQGGVKFGPTANQDIFVEMIDIVPPNNTVLHVFPTLYR